MVHSSKKPTSEVEGEQGDGIEAQGAVDSLGITRDPFFEPVNHTHHPHVPSRLENREPTIHGEPGSLHTANDHDVRVSTMNADAPGLVNTSGRVDTVNATSDGDKKTLDALCEPWINYQGSDAVLERSNDDCTEFDHFVDLAFAASEFRSARAPSSLCLPLLRVQRIRTANWVLDQDRLH